MADIRRQEIHCHNCLKYVQFDLDLEMNGNHELTCPVCGHKHLRVVKNGEITEERWGTTNAPVIPISNNTVSWTTASTFTSYSNTQTANSVAMATTGTSATAQYFMYQSWLDKTGTS